jgi:hypothetical protein
MEGIRCPQPSHVRTPSFSIGIVCQTILLRSVYVAIIDFSDTSAHSEDGLALCRGP